MSTVFFLRNWWLSSWSTNFPLFMGNQRLIIECTRVDLRILPRTRWIQSKPSRFLSLSCISVLHLRVYLGLPRGIFQKYSRPTYTWTVSQIMLKFHKGNCHQSCPKNPICSLPIYNRNHFSAMYISMYPMNRFSDFVDIRSGRLPLVPVSRFQFLAISFLIKLDLRKAMNGFRIEDFNWCVFHMPIFKSAW